MPHRTKHLSRKRRENAAEAQEILREIVRRGFTQEIDYDEFCKTLIKVGLRDARTHDSWLEFFLVSGWMRQKGRIDVGVYTLHPPATVDIRAYVEEA